MGIDMRTRLLSVLQSIENDSERFVAIETACSLPIGANDTMPDVFRKLRVELTAQGIAEARDFDGEPNVYTRAITSVEQCRMSMAIVSLTTAHVIVRGRLVATDSSFSGIPVSLYRYEKGWYLVALSNEIPDIIIRLIPHRHVARGVWERMGDKREWLE